MHGAIRNKWENLGWERGALGYPTSDERTLSETELKELMRGEDILIVSHSYNRCSEFEEGRIYFWSPDNHRNVLTVVHTDGTRTDERHPRDGCKFSCPRCRRVMELTPKEVTELRYACPFCFATGNVNDPRSEQTARSVPPAQEPEPTVNIYDDRRFSAEEQAGTKSHYFRGWRYYRSGENRVFEERARNKVPEGAFGASLSGTDAVSQVLEPPVPPAQEPEPTVNIYDNRRFSAEERVGTKSQYFRGWRYYSSGKDRIFEERARNKIPEGELGASPSGADAISHVPESPASPPKPTLTRVQRTFSCPRCWRVMVLTLTEYVEERYACPYCFATGSMAEPRSERPASSPPASQSPAEEAASPPSTSEWTECSICHVTLKTKNLQRHRKNKCRPRKPPPSTPSDHQTHYSPYPSEKKATFDYTSYRSTSYHYKPGAATCARCGRYVEWPTYYNGEPYGSYCIQRVRGW